MQKTSSKKTIKKSRFSEPGLLNIFYFFLVFFRIYFSTSE